MSKPVEPCPPSTYLAVFGHEKAGQAILAELKLLFYDSSSFDPDPQILAYNTGKRDVINFILTKMEFKPNLLEE